MKCQGKKKKNKLLAFHISAQLWHQHLADIYVSLHITLQVCKEHPGKM